jgi:hypothetical protein
LATLTTQNITLPSSAFTLPPSTGGAGAMECGPKMSLRVNNGGGAPITVTIAIPAASSAYSNVAYASSTFSVPNGAAREFGSVDGFYRDPITGLATITYSAVTSVTVGAVKLVD